MLSIARTAIYKSRPPQKCLLNLLGTFNKQTVARPVVVPSITYFSTDHLKDNKSSSILDMPVIHQIKAELMSVDKNSDGHLDADELKELLRKHATTFSDKEILELPELYYAGKAGGSVSFDRFIKAADYAAQKERHSSFQQESSRSCFKDTGRHPLELGRDGLEFTPAYKSHHGHYTAQELNVTLTHVEPIGMSDKLAYTATKVVRFLFDSATGWKNESVSVNQIMNRVIYLETIAAVPGMVAAIIRHFKSLRTMQPDGGMLQMFLEEANNERMHLLTFVRMKDPSRFFRFMVLAGQLGFGTVFTLAYAISPNFCHRFVGYVEEEACSTYTKIIKAIEIAPEGSELAAWRTEPAPSIALAYWKLGDKGTVLDLMYAVRADEAEHRDVNHLVCGIKEGQCNPLYDPESKLDEMLVKYVNDIMTRPPAKSSQA
jgi:hypothetical protein